MSDDMTNHGHSGVEFEREDLSTRGVFVFMAGLSILGIAIYFVIVGMYTFLDHYEHSQMATASPLVQSKGSINRVVTQADMDKAFKDNGAPMLETNEMGQMSKFVMDQETQLNRYDWVDENAGVARIPIDRAMDLLVQKGLPVYAPGNKDSVAAPQKPAAVKK